MAIWCASIASSSRRRPARARHASTGWIASGRYRCAASIAPGFGLADRIEALREAAAGARDAAGVYSVTVAGRGRELERTFVEFGWAFLLSIVFMYMVLAAQYESLAHPLIILLSLPLSLPFALASLWASGNTLNLYSALGMLVLFGVVAKNAILQVDHARNLLAQGVALGPAVLQASRDRLRPDPDDDAGPRGGHAAAGARQPALAPKSGAPSRLSSSAARACRSSLRSSSHRRRLLSRRVARERFAERRAAAIVASA